MAEVADAPACEQSCDTAGLAIRALRAIEWLICAQAATAKREAQQDAARLIAGIAFAVGAASLLAAAVVLAEVAAVFFVQARFALSWPVALLSVAGGDAAIAVLMYALARRRLSRPVLSETRAMVRRAAAVITGG